MAVLRSHRVSSFATSLARNRTPGPSAVVISAHYGPGLKQVEIVPPTQTHSAGSPWGPRTITTLLVQSGEGRGRHITGTDSPSTSRANPVRIHQNGFIRLHQSAPRKAAPPQSRLWMCQLPASVASLLTATGRNQLLDRGGAAAASANPTRREAAVGARK
jgi:hypothetical protein